MLLALVVRLACVRCFARLLPEVMYVCRCGAVLCAGCQRRCPRCRH
jgi:hypothetical protein